jgi:hypothetical protein
LGLNLEETEAAGDILPEAMDADAGLEPALLVMGSFKRTSRCSDLRT